jgi:CheY-like chemotaxis protein
LLTAAASGELAEQARALRANGYIVKPVTPDVLALRVERAMAR